MVWVIPDAKLEANRSITGLLAAEAPPPSGDWWLFHDDFSSGDSSHAENGIYWANGNGVAASQKTDYVVEALPAPHAGLNGIKLTQQGTNYTNGSPQQANLWLNGFRAPLWVRWSVRIPSDYYHRNLAVLIIDAAPSAPNWNIGDTVQGDAGTTATIYHIDEGANRVVIDRPSALYSSADFGSGHTLQNLTTAQSAGITSYSTPGNNHKWLTAWEREYSQHGFGLEVNADPYQDNPVAGTSIVKCHQTGGSYRSITLDIAPDAPDWNPGDTIQGGVDATAFVRYVDTETSTIWVDVMQSPTDAAEWGVGVTITNLDTAATADVVSNNAAAQYAGANTDQSHRNNSDGSFAYLIDPSTDAGKLIEYTACIQEASALGASDGVVKVWKKNVTDGGAIELVYSNDTQIVSFDPQWPGLTSIYFGGAKNGGGAKVDQDYYLTEVFVGIQAPSDIPPGDL
ncbi:hypothetical protein HCH_02890 [Hahella chejuensis KCTC 2396]|uniref:Uncharacterized protein n=1 Tax=Hahella chejuensis (strain KCTC 2396) TaxID=349521 RepID=Q2SI59_HAHCH|nr:hypothetical protein [Hahella chejuensis]ABC29665.1 hypothetical protein HCH_02890 [Hahella chejuensis KCTC 2396]